MSTARTHRTRPRTAGATTALAESSPTEKLQRTLPNAAMAHHEHPEPPCSSPERRAQEKEEQRNNGADGDLRNRPVPEDPFPLGRQELASARVDVAGRREPGHAGRQDEYGAGHPHPAAPVGEEDEGDEEERPDVPAQRVVMALPRPVEDVSQLHFTLPRLSRCERPRRACPGTPAGAHRRTPYP